MATVSFLFVPLAAFAAFLTVSNTYLLLLTVCKGFFDAQLLFRITLFVKSGEVGFLAWNGCFFLTAASFLIFLLAEASAARFSFENQARDFSLLFSGPFFKYLLEALLLILLATVFYLVWPRLLSLLPTL